MPALSETKLPNIRKRRRITAEEIRMRERIKNHLIREWEIEEYIAKIFAKKHAYLMFDEVTRSVENLVAYFQNLHVSHYGYSIDPLVLRGALNHTLQRFARSRKPLSEKQLGYFLQLSKDEQASKITSSYDPGSEEERAKVLSPLKQVLVYEDDEAMRQRLLFIYKLFVKEGMRITKKKVIQACSSHQSLFPRRRVVEDALETLRGAYEALGFVEGELFITPEYLSIN
ncbi:MAG: hypothetical protein C4527_13970 [Candidatus Omnitrophota bacterium]|jgi:hypothetical protein|nr:MAG: hypothetical protein C4527_13970 [Candidatus Omnitrophota bacterium]